jgi:hypothetical protein
MRIMSKISKRVLSTANYSKTTLANSKIPPVIIKPKNVSEMEN